MLNKELIERILSAVKEDRKRYDSANKHAKALGISGAAYSHIVKGETEKYPHMLIRIARTLNVAKTKEHEWKTAETRVFLHIETQLKKSQKNSVGGIFCDACDIGKTYSAKEYVRKNRNAVYIDCSQHKTKQQLIRAIANGFSLDNKGKLIDVKEDLIFYLKSIENPLIILDEAGDTRYEADLEIKSLWNATEGYCGWYMMGAEGLQAKINRAIHNKKVGYAELFRRFGGRFQSIFIQNKDLKTQDELHKEAALLVAKANISDTHTIKELLSDGDFGLSRIKTNILKVKS